MAEERAGQAARDLPVAEELAGRLADYADAHAPNRYLREMDDHFTVCRDDNGRPIARLRPTNRRSWRISW